MKANLQELKQKLIKISPFLTYTFFGIENCLAVGNPLVPLSICVTPPTPAFILESGHITTMILRYSKTYQKQVKESRRALTKEDADKIQSEVETEIMSSEEQQAKQLGVILRLGRSFLQSNTLYGYYSEPKDKFDVVFTDDKEAADEMNGKPDFDGIAVWTNSVADLDLIQVGMSLIEALPSDSPANVEIVSDTAEQGILNKGVETVPANSLADFPRDLRNIAVEDVSE